MVNAESYIQVKPADAQCSSSLQPLSHIARKKVFFNEPINTNYN
jgi:hypothetical protein